MAAPIHARNIFEATSPVDGPAINTRGHFNCKMTVVVVAGPSTASITLQSSPDGVNWKSEGTAIALAAAATGFVASQDFAGIAQKFVRASITTIDSGTLTCWVTLTGNADQAGFLSNVQG